MAENNDIKIVSRVTLKHDTEANWKTKTTFAPMESEMIIYDEDETHNYKRIKIGDGTTFINELPFATISDAELTERLSVIQDQINSITTNGLQVSETQPGFACTWFRVTS